LKYKKLILEKKERDQKIAGLTLERYQTSTLERKTLSEAIKPYDF